MPSTLGNPGARPKLAGSYWDWQTEERASTPPSIGGIVAVIDTSAWGPLNTPVLCVDSDDFVSKFGSDDTPLARAVYGAFKGEGVGGVGGAGAVLAVRAGVATGGSRAVKAAHTLQNSTPADAITLTARYEGTRGNNLALTVQAGVRAGTKDLIVLDGATPIRTYTHDATDLAALVDAINASDPYLAATLVLDGVALANVSAQSLTGGTDGAALTGTEWTNVMTALDSERFAYVGAGNLTDATIRTALVAWALARNARGQRCTLGVGGAAGETVATGNARSIAINSWEVLNLAGSGLHDNTLDRDLSTAELVTRYLGARAARGERADDIYVRFADVEPIDGQPLATLQEQEDALDAGSIVFSRDTDSTAPIFVREGVTTYSDDSVSPTRSDGSKTRPASGPAGWGRIKNLAVQHGVELEALEWATGPQGPLGSGRAVNDKTRALLVGFYRTAYQRRVDAEIIQPGFTVKVAADPPPSDDDDAVFIDHGFHPTRSVRQIFNLARIG